MPPLPPNTPTPPLPSTIPQDAKAPFVEGVDEFAHIDIYGTGLQESVSKSDKGGKQEEDKVAGGEEEMERRALMALGGGRGGGGEG